MRAAVRAILFSAIAAVGSTVAAQSQSPLVTPPRSAAPAEDGQWLMPAKNFASTRYSELSEINAENIAALQVDFAFSTGAPKGEEAAPIIVGDTMYVLTPFPKVLYALDLSKPGAPLKWKISYDPDLNLIYYGTANPGPWNSDSRPGDNKWTAGIFARDADTGKAKWFYQWSPHDLFDHDGVNENVLLDLDWNGNPRKTLVHPDRNGYVYVFDRATGEVLSAEPFAYVNGSKGVDLKTGRAIVDNDLDPRDGTAALGFVNAVKDLKSITRPGDTLYVFRLP